MGTFQPAVATIHSGFRSANSGKEYNIKELITCNSTHMTYVLECPCHIQYVGRTTRPLLVRIREHITNIKNGYHKHSVSRHFKDCHNKDLVWSSMGLTKLKDTGGERTRKLKSHKMRPNGSSCWTPSNQQE